MRQSENKCHTQSPLGDTLRNSVMLCGLPKRRQVQASSALNVQSSVDSAWLICNIFLHQLSGQRDLGLCSHINTFVSLLDYWHNNVSNVGYIGNVSDHKKFSWGSWQSCLLVSWKVDLQCGIFPNRPHTKSAEIVNARWPKPRC